MLRKTRKIVEFFCLLLIILIPIVSYMNSLRQVYGIKGFHVANLSGGWLVGKLYAIYENTLGKLEDPVKLIDSVKGSFWSITVFGIKVSDPLAVIGHLLATKQFYESLLIGALIPLGFTLLFGRAFCGWICPMNTITELGDRLRNRLIKCFPWIMDVNIGLDAKYWIFLLSAIFITITGIPLFAYYLPYTIFSREMYNLFFLHTFGLGIWFLALLILMELFFSRRGWCRYLCPGGALFSIIGTYSLLRLVKKGGRACPEACNECNLICPMGLEVHNGKPGRECSQCGECMVSCSQGNLKFVLHIRRGAAYSLTIIFLIIITFFITATSSAHHIAGLPHYGYAENYPQVPLTEQRQQSGEYFLSLTTIFFQGIKQELSNIPYDTQFYIHISKKDMAGGHSVPGFQNPFDPDIKKKHVNTGENANYTGKQLLLIKDKNKMEVGRYSLDTPAEETIYRFRHYFDQPGKYFLEVTFFPNGKEKTVVFPVEIKVRKKFPGATAIVLSVAAVVGLAIFFWKKKRIYSA